MKSEKLNLIKQKIESEKTYKGPIIGDYIYTAEKQIRSHQNTFLMIEDYENGHYNVSTINVIRGIAHYRGKSYGTTE
jgi:hypothetical protein